MKISQKFAVAKNPSSVWNFFQDIPRVARCLPGAEYLGPTNEGKHAGRITSKVGPIRASFEGEAAVRYDDASRLIHVEGNGADKKAASQGKMTMDCRISELDGTTVVTIEADVQLFGAIAQFGRTGLIVEIAKVLIANFAKNVEEELSVVSFHQDDVEPASWSHVRGGAPISGLAMLTSALKAWVLVIFGKRTS